MKRFNLKLKDFTKILVCLILIVFTLGLAACGRSNNDNFTYPTSQLETVGNGGMAVRKGDYLYFVNGYISSADMETQNASYTVGALMIAKLDQSGNIILNEDDLLDDEYYRIMSDRLCGFEATGLYIFGDYLYFTSPCQENESGDEVWAQNRVDFYRIRLDRSGDVERLYQSEVEHSNLEYEYYYNGSNVYLLVYEKEANLDNSDITNRLLRIDANSKDVQTIDTNVSSVVMSDTNNEFISNAYEKIFYVQDNSESEDADYAYVLKRYDIVNNNSTDFRTSNDDMTALFVTNNYVYITDNTNSRSIMMRASLSGNSGFERSGPINTSLYSTLVMTPEGNCIVGIRSESTAIEFFIYGDDTASCVIEDSEESVTSVTFIGFANGYVVYYDNNNAIKMVSYANVMSNSNAEVITVATLSDINTSYFDLDGEYLYFYKTVGSHSYLHRLAINNNFDESEEMIGVYLEEDIPEETEESEETEATA